MSAKDTLDRLQSDWDRHREWRKSGADGKTGPIYYSDDRVRLHSLPSDVRDAVVRDMNAIIGAAVDERYQAALQRAKAAAVAEAKRTLEQLAAEGA
jgi:regulator of protease activity HflC (stomatin/prohibitin superfamily)